MYPTRRSPLIVLISLVLVILTACGPAPVPTAAPAASTQAPASAPTQAPAATAAPASAANTLTIDSNIDDLITLDPGVVYEYSGILVVHNVYQNLVKFVGADLQTIKPDLADSWDTKDAGDHW